MMQKLRRNTRETKWKTTSVSREKWREEQTYRILRREVRQQWWQLLLENSRTSPVWFYYLWACQSYFLAWEGLVQAWRNGQECSNVRGFNYIKIFFCEYIWICVQVCMCPCVCRFTGTHVCACMWRPEGNLGYCSLRDVHFFFPLVLSFASSLGCLAIVPQRSPRFCLPSTGIAIPCHHA